MVFPHPPVGGDACVQFANNLKVAAPKLSVDYVDGATFAGDRGCILSIRIGNLTGLLLTRAHGLTGVAVRCLGEGASLGAGNACGRVIYSLRIEAEEPARTSHTEKRI